ncbi:hypothetical protein [Actinomadura sp. 3N407]|uniref:hypothetical protein n=1 Tax=Actinomadura sp. 3N407 TaxID=3457423 RepID=UPI003FCEA3D2
MDHFAVVAWMQDDELDRHPAHAVRRLDPVLAGLRHVLDCGRPPPPRMDHRKHRMTS